MANKFLLKPLNMAMQARGIKKVFPRYQLNFNHNQLYWKGSVTPTPLSKTYNVEMLYDRGRDPDVFVTSPLSLFSGETKLPHVYDTAMQWLCLYHRPSGEWKNYMWIHRTIIPWIFDWLAHYEVWLTDGIWHGGGITHQ
jgi:hypothetical protein